MTISRYSETEVDNITTQDTTVLYNNIPCKLSKAGKGGYPSNGETRNSTQVDMMLICGPDVDIKFGDEVTVTKSGQKLKLKIGKPIKYKGSIQTPCEVIESA